MHMLALEFPPVSRLVEWKTLFGSGANSYRGALSWATLTTFAGSLTALLLSEKLVSRSAQTALTMNHLPTAAPM